MGLDWRGYLMLAVFALPWPSQAAQVDPVPSVMWDYYHARLLDGAPFVFDERVRVQVPPFAEDARQVPVQVDASRSSTSAPASRCWRVWPSVFGSSRPRRSAPRC